MDTFQNDIEIDSIISFEEWEKLITNYKAI